MIKIGPGLGSMYFTNPPARSGGSPYTNVKTWSLDTRWIYSLPPGIPFPSSSEPVPVSFTVTGGSGWTTGTYTILNTVYNWTNNVEGSQNMLYLASSPTSDISIDGGQGILNFAIPWNDSAAWDDSTNWTDTN